MQRIVDIRSFFAALALLIVGLLFSIGNMFYFNLDYFGRDIFMARWLWEILLNIQILCYAFMWFAHYNRISLADGYRRRKAIFDFILGIIAVSGPIVVLAIGAYSGWVRDPGSKDSIVIIHYVFVAFWVLVTWIVPGIRRLQTDIFNAAHKTFDERLLGWLKTYWIGIVMLALMTVGEMSSHTFVYILTPFLGYLQSAVGYFKKSMRLSAYDRAY